MLKRNFLQRILALAVSVCILASFTTFFSFPASAEAVSDYSLTCNGLTLKFSPDTGKLTSVMIGGNDLFVADSENGFVITDVKNDRKFNATGKMLKSGHKLTQKITVPDGGLELTVTYHVRGNGIFVEGSIKDTTNSERCISLEYLTPLKAENMMWYNNLDEADPISKGRAYYEGRNYVQNHYMSTYPFGVVSNGKEALAVAVPTDPPLASLEMYDYTEGRQAMVMKYDFGISPEVEALRSRADFSFMIYAPEEPEWGFRSAMQGYYETYPELFVDRLEKGGNWLFQHNVSNLEGIEDFSIIIDETPGFEACEANGIYSTIYTAPAEAVIDWPQGEGWPSESEWVVNPLDGILSPSYEAFMGRFDVLKQRTDKLSGNFPGFTVAEDATAIENSATFNKQGEYALWGWLVYGQHAHFNTNHSPHLPGLNLAQGQMAKILNAHKTAADFGTELDGVYIDNLSGGDSLNYRKDHMKYSTLPLLWDKDYTLAMPLMTSTYEYAKWIREYTLENDMVTIGNVVFPELKGAAKYASLIDAPGSECGVEDNVYGMDISIMRLRRTLTYRKPWMLLLGNAQGVPSGLEGKEILMKNAMVYGIFANIMGYRVDKSSWEQCRYLFRKYAPVTELQDRLGWEPITYAKFENPVSGIIERFGDFTNDSIVMTVYNGSYDETLSEKVIVDLNKIGLDKSKWEGLRAFDIVNNEAVELTLNATTGELSFAKELYPEDATAIMIATEDEIFNYLAEYCTSDFTRISSALISIPKTIETFREELPEGYDKFEEAMVRITSLSSNDMAVLKKNAAEIVKAIDDSTSDVTKVFSNMSLTRTSFNNHIVLTTSRIRSKLGGFIEGLPFVKTETPAVTPPVEDKPSEDEPVVEEPVVDNNTDNEPDEETTQPNITQTIIRTTVNQIEEIPNNTSTVIIICCIVIIACSLISAGYRFFYLKGQNRK